MPTRISLGEYEAWITVEGVEVEHYGVEIDEEKKEATCWIASEAGKHFEMWAMKKHTRFSCCTSPFLDGQQLGGGFMSKDETHPSEEKIVNVGNGEGRRLKFSSIMLTDDESSLEVPLTSKSIGELKIVISHAVEVASDPEEPHEIVIPEEQRLHERSKKAMVHQIGFGECVPLDYEITFIEELGQVAAFTFLYRSIDILRATDIAPRGPVSEPEAPVYNTTPPQASKGKRKAPDVKEEECDNDLKDAEEIEEEGEMLAVIERMQADIERIKNKINTRKRVQPPKKKVKQEAKPVFLPGEVIDLT